MHIFTTFPLQKYNYFRFNHIFVKKNLYRTKLLGLWSLPHAKFLKGIAKYFRIVATEI